MRFSRNLNITYIVVALAGAAFMSWQMYEMSQLLTSADTTPKQVELQFMQETEVLRHFEHIYFIILFIISIIIHYRRALGNFYIFTTALFVTFVLIDYLILSESFFHYRQQHELWEGGFSANGIYGMSISLGTILLASFTYLILQRIWSHRFRQIRQ